MSDTPQVPPPEVGRPIPGRRYTLMLVPEGGAGRIRQVTLTLAQARLWTGAIALVLVLAVIGAGMLVTTLPRTLAYGDLVEENLALKSHLREVDRKLDQVDDELRRLRMYDTQLRDLPVDALPGWGPLEDDEEALRTWSEAQGAALEGDWSPSAVFHDDGPAFIGDGASLLGDPMEEPPGDEIASASLSRTEAWALAVDDRTDRTLQVLAASEPRLAWMVETAADWREMASSLPLGVPVPDGVLTSGFGYRRSPFTRAWKFHSGLDLAAPRGTPIYAPGDGVVVTADWNQGYGRMIEIDHGWGLLSRYAHNSAVFVHAGDKVRRGQVISTVGSTGQTTGPHLHYEIEVDGQKVDPLEYLRR